MVATEDERPFIYWGYGIVRTTKAKADKSRRAQFDN